MTSLVLALVRAFAGLSDAGIATIVYLAIACRSFTFREVGGEEIDVPLPH